MPNVRETVLNVQERQKPSKSLEVRKMRDWMNPPPKIIPREPAATYREAVVRLRDKPWLQSRQHKDKVKFTDYSTASPELADFCGKLIRRLAKMHCPLECVSASYDVAFIQHSRRGADLSPKEWELIAHYGAEICRQYGLKVRWGGLGVPTVWMSDRPASECPAEAVL